jgi:hypothetical protein
MIAKKRLTKTPHIIHILLEHTHIHTHTNLGEFPEHPRKWPASRLHTTSLHERGLGLQHSLPRTRAASGAYRSVADSAQTSRNSFTREKNVSTT